MKHSDKHVSRGRFSLPLVVAVAVISGLGAIPGVVCSTVAIEQQPLTVSNNVPGNLVLTPSVEWPTVMSMSNLGSFSPTKTYGGYFDPNKCYKYDSSGTIPVDTPAPKMKDPVSAVGYFVPDSVSSASPATCSGLWSGNYLNWAATQTIDTFRSVMTGGYRVVDTSAKTVLEKARHTGQTDTGSLDISGAPVSAATPSPFKYFFTKLNGLGNKMYFVSADTNPGTKCDKNGRNCSSTTLRDALNNPKGAANKGVDGYTGQDIKSGYVYSVNIDVLVCKSGLLESNCVKYGSNYKPEGLIQKYSKSFKYSVFGYLNISNMLQDGAALRAQQKFVGPYTYDPLAGQLDNAAKEWDPDTGVFVKNPDADDATKSTTALGATISDSGVINYINKFGEMNDGNDKSFDPVSEMYYAAIRYLKNQSAVASYSDIATYPDGSEYKMADGFPVITKAADPIKYSCQKNFILGIGDANTHRDKNLPGNTTTGEEPAVPAEVAADKTVDVVKAINQIATIEGIQINTPFSGRNNSAYIAGLAYDSHTVDMRSDLTGMQTVSTYWVDVEENQKLEGVATNQYLLATKYGGFAVPAGYSPYTNKKAFDQAWWSTSGDILTTSNVNKPRPDNFFEGGNATSMRNGLNAAFSAIASANAGSSASLSLNSSQLQDGSTVYQASYVEGAWSGALKAFAIDPLTKTVSGSATWVATLPDSASRKVYTNVGDTYEEFNSTNVSGNGWTPDTVDYIRGSAAKEIKNGGTLRNRTSALGDVVDSQPVYVGAPNAALFHGATFTGSSDYLSFATKAAVAGRAPVVYVAANDGMLHGFNAATGVETYAYMPGAVASASINPSTLAQVSYGSGVNPHQYFNDGELTVADAYFSNAWHTVLVGTTGRGLAKSVYALDVTDPADVKFLWEYSAKDNNDIGQVVGKPIVAQTSAGWVALVGNGYNSTNGTAALLSFPLDGSKPTTFATDSTTSNGLATPGVWIDNTSNYVSTKAFAGDLAGHLWEFDLGSKGDAGTLVFSTQNSQPITATVALGKDPATNHLWAFFGTGKYLSANDLADKSVQSWYGLIVDGTVPVAQKDLVERKVIAETNGVAADPTATPPKPAVEPGRVFSAGTAGDMAGKSGWYMDLLPSTGTDTAEGERMLVANQFIGGYLIGASLIPDTSNACAPGGRGWVMSLDPFTGTNPKDVFFDMNHDGVFDDSDRVKVGNAMVASGGIGFSSLMGLPSFSGPVMLNNLNGLISTTLTNPSAGKGGRVSWREIVH
ncbi:pilus assembly protein [Dyella sp.]|uniref:pilus assembly protein n=1 Tax=Dyella sp. TaxID=1869338 RepID=UPI003F80C55E